MGEGLSNRPRHAETAMHPIANDEQHKQDYDDLLPPSILFQNCTRRRSRTVSFGLNPDHYETVDDPLSTEANAASCFIFVDLKSSTDCDF